MGLEQTEGNFKQKLTKGLRSCNALVVQNLQGYRSEPGIPDLFIAHGIFSGYVEVKGPKTKLTAKQKWFLQELDRRAVPAMILRMADCEGLGVFIGGWAWSNPIFTPYDPRLILEALRDRAYELGIDPIHRRV